MVNVPSRNTDDYNHPPSRYNFSTHLDKNPQPSSLLQSPIPVFSSSFWYQMYRQKS
ncbi:hypothetical protein SEHO0A_04114 [Salmonella enterica subsp. houtenae str. ATCC BAA-1581]|nr:hypothetical protein SEHO0A_04114 [Salmonella enterica subsp. houtenae str. ATCC BAA-1581]